MIFQGDVEIAVSFDILYLNIGTRIAVRVH